MMVKICGITNPEDALAAVESGATALGFNFCPASPRYVRPEDARSVIHALPQSVWKVGIFVNEPRDWVESLARLLDLDVVQLHGDEQPDQYPSGLRVWKAARIRNGFEAARLDEDPAEAMLLDGPSSGTSFDWKLARNTAKKVIIAGGLDAGNVRLAIETAHPWGVDACSRLESAPGRKDHARMRGFIAAALEADL